MSARAASTLLLHILFIGAVLPLPATSDLAQSTSTAEQPLRFMSFNIRYNNPDDGINAWPHRRERVAGLIRFHQADLIGVQEALGGMLDELDERLPEHNWFGVGRADGEDEGEFSAIFYRPQRLELLEHDTFWLSETPAEVGSVGWDAALERIVTWGRFRDRVTGDEFYHFNTHFDHRGEEARRQSARLILERVEEIAGSTPVVVTGDFNATPDSEPYAVMTGADGLQDAFRTAEQPHYGPASTWTGFEEITPERRIDYIFVNDSVRVRQHGILSDRWDGRFPSDHLPVLAEVTFDSP